MSSIGKIFGLLVALLSPSSVIASSVPPNELRIEIDSENSLGLTQTEFNQLSDATIVPWIKIAKKRGVDLVIKKDWMSSFVASFADQQGSTWLIDMKGGLARHRRMTRDSYVLVVCHELGHHFGGFPFEYYWTWNANEGQSDYFATHTCARLIWSKEIEKNSTFRASIDPHQKLECDKVWGEKNAQNLCYRIATASLELAQFFASLGDAKVPKFDTPDTSIVSKTMVDYPKTQCRLDTYLRGTLCLANFDLEIIPGLGHPAGQNSLEAEFEAAQQCCTETTGYRSGTRPACWFKANY